MHDFYTDELFTREHSRDLMQEAAREREIRRVETTPATAPQLGRTDLRTVKLVKIVVENERRITVEVR